MASGDWERCSATTRSGRVAKYLLVALGTLALNACGSPYYTSDPIEARVVDADTGQPIEGAIVTANWQLIGPSLDTGGRKVGQLEVMETVTDKDGRLFFPGFTKINPSGAELREEDPQILIFKPGYSYIRVANQYPLGKEGDQGAHRKSSISGQTLKMKKADSNKRKYALELGLFTTNLDNIVFGGRVDAIPKMIHALACERNRLREMDPSIGPIPVPALTDTSHCE
jgi:hypothetical protein